MIGLDPIAVWEVGFEHEAALPAAERTTLRVRFSTARQYSRSGALMVAANGGPDGQADLPAERRMALLGEAIGLVAVAWVRPGGEEPFDAAKLPDLLTIEEHWELVAAIMHGSRLAEADRKKSALQLASAATRKSASDAPAAGA